MLNKILGGLYGQALGDAMGAASVQKVGAGRNVPSRQEVQAVLDSNHTGIKLSC